MRKCVQSFRALMLIGICLPGIATATAATSASTLVDATTRYRHWMTVYTNNVPLQWQWPEGASHAALSVTGMNGTTTIPFNEPTEGYVWQAFPTAEPATEDIYDLTLTFYANNQTPLQIQTVRLAVVKGAFGATPVDASEASQTWTRLKGNVVLSYDAAWEPPADGAHLQIARLGDTAQDVLPADTQSGYYAWNFSSGHWDYGKFLVTLTFLGTETTWRAELDRYPGGTLLQLR